ncbi:MAG TPA: hypothetical protein VGP63_02750 [Planctomycetaceae bacterium]|nr:hypothetical protein [Planctomycetaceae bacterium]
MSAASSDSNAEPPREHFVTLFDDSFLPIGLALYQSLVAHARPFRLWVVAIDAEVERHLGQLALPDLTVIPLASIESPELLAVKAGRTRAEYCWTLTPFTAQAVFDRDPTALRATYLDADLFFLSDPQILLDELDQSRKNVLITEHAYAPEYDRSHDSGRFCVQFLTFDRSDRAHEVMRWWQERCLEWCFARYENGKFGDQIYLDQWPTLFGDRVHIVRQVEKTLAPWNVRHFSQQGAQQTQRRLEPVFYHFHGLRLLGGRRARLFKFYDVSAAGLTIYERYLVALANSYAQLDAAGIRPPTHSLPPERWGWLKSLERRLKGTERFAKIPSAPLSNRPQMSPAVGTVQAKNQPARR